MLPLSRSRSANPAADAGHSGVSRLHVVNALFFSGRCERNRLDYHRKASKATKRHVPCIDRLALSPSSWTNRMSEHRTFDLRACPGGGCRGLVTPGGDRHQALVHCKDKKALERLPLSALARHYVGVSLDPGIELNKQFCNDNTF